MFFRGYDDCGGYDFDLLVLSVVLMPQIVLEKVMSLVELTESRYWNFFNVSATRTY